MTFHYNCFDAVFWIEMLDGTFFGLREVGISSRVPYFGIRSGSASWNRRVRVASRLSTLIRSHGVEEMFDLLGFTLE